MQETSYITKLINGDNPPNDIEQLKIIKSNNDCGDDIKCMLESVYKYLGTTRQAYIDSSNSEYFDTKCINQYAACVPHLTIYPDPGIIPIGDVKFIKLK